MQCIMGVSIPGTGHHIIIKRGAGRIMNQDVSGNGLDFFHLAEESGEVFWKGLVDGSAFSYVSPSFERIWKRSRHELYTNPGVWFDGIHREDRDRIFTAYKDFIRKEGHFDQEFRVERKDGTVRWMWARALIARDHEGRAMALEGLALDITERKKGEEKLKTSLHEKEVLLREIHHRVKNNLQMVSSLLNLQANYVQEPRLRELINASKHRVRSMALVHEKLYHSIDAAYLDFGEYLRTITAYLIRSSGREDISCTVEAGKVRFGLDTAIPCGLIVNELISNALRHAFPEGRSGLIHIQLRPQPHGAYLLAIRDDGVGFPRNFDFHNAGTLGLQLFNDLVNQLEGAAELDISNGTKFSIRFKARPVEIDDSRVPFY
jgi:PAS domain S-box-containing protein